MLKWLPMSLKVKASVLIIIYKVLHKSSCVLLFHWVHPLSFFSSHSTPARWELLLFFKHVKLVPISELWACYFPSPEGHACYDLLPQLSLVLAQMSSPLKGCLQTA